MDVYNNRIGRGGVYVLTANLRPHPRMELEYQMTGDYIDSKEPVEGSSRILNERVQQLLMYWHFTARDSVRATWQSQMVRRAPSLWTFPVPARENMETVSLVYGHRPSIHTTSKT